MARTARSKKSGVRGMHGRHHANTEPNPVGRPSGTLPFGQMYKPKKRRY